jgi:hypothetical protein
MNDYSNYFIKYNQGNNNYGVSEILAMPKSIQGIKNLNELKMVIMWLIKGTS